MAVAGYIDRAYVANSLGHDWIEAVSERVSVEHVIKQATSNVRADVRKLGYDPPAPGAAFESLNDETNPASQETYDILQSATLGHVYVTLSIIPDARVELPDNWHKHAGYIAMEKIRVEPGDDRAVELALPLRPRAAVGGVVTTEASPTVSISQGSNPARATRAKLADY
jgi:hypothetical protein